MSGKAKQFAQRNPVVTGTGVGGTIAAGIIAGLGRAGITLGPDEVALLVLVAGWAAVGIRAWMDRHGAEE